MGENTNIEWATHTFNTHWGCARVSPACERCYAETFAKRVGHGARLPQIWGVNAERKFFGDKHWAEPLKWNAAAEKAGERHRVFCSSMADVFEDREDLIAVRARLAVLIANTPALDWLLLTKRPENMVKLARGFWPKEWPRNVWAGATVENQDYADKRIPWLVEVPARIRFLSCEPLLGAVDLENVHPYYLKRDPSPHDPIVRIDCLRGHVKGPDDMTDAKIAWVIVGGESGGGARPFNLAFAQDIVRQCKDAGVACHVKQLGAKPFHPAIGPIKLRDKKGGDLWEWPGDLRVREFPRGVA